MEIDYYSISAPPPVWILLPSYPSKQKTGLKYQPVSLLAPRRPCQPCKAEKRPDSVLVSQPLVSNDSTPRTWNIKSRYLLRIFII